MNKLNLIIKTKESSKVTASNSCSVWNNFRNRTWLPPLCSLCACLCALASAFHPFAQQLYRWCSSYKRSTNYNKLFDVNKCSFIEYGRLWIDKTFDVIGLQACRELLITIPRVGQPWSFGPGYEVSGIRLIVRVNDGHCSRCAPSHLLSIIRKLVWLSLLLQQVGGAVWVASGNWSSRVSVGWRGHGVAWQSGSVGGIGRWVG